MSAEPLVARIPPRANLLVSLELEAAYMRARKPELREDATVPLFEELCNHWLRCPSLSVYSQQHLDRSNQAVDVTVGFHDSQSFDPIFVLLMECKRHRVQARGELESQLQEYGDRYLDKGKGGLAKHDTVYGATAFGTQIRFFKFSRVGGKFEDRTFSGALHRPEEQAYWDVMTDGIKIHAVLKEIWDFRKGIAPLRPARVLPSLQGAPVGPLPSAAMAPTASTQTRFPGFNEVTFIPTSTPGYYAYKLLSDGAIKASSMNEWVDGGSYRISNSLKLFGRKPT